MARTALPRRTERRRRRQAVTSRPTGCASAPLPRPPRRRRPHSRSGGRLWGKLSLTLMALGLLWL
ncbi:MAG: hypothetical protein ACK5N0_10675, partial [Synechococcaceae cyanobacterium]